MTSFDYAVLGVIGLSMLVGLFRGLVRELVSLAGWIAASAAAIYMAPQAAVLVPAQVSNPLARVALAFVVVFLAVLLLSSLAGWLLSKLVGAAGLGVADRILGSMFGFLRGTLVVLVAVFLAGLTPLPREPAWRDAVLSGPLETAIVALKPVLPRELAQRVKFR